MVRVGIPAGHKFNKLCASGLVNKHKRCAHFRELQVMDSIVDLLDGEALILVANTSNKEVKILSEDILGSFCAVDAIESDKNNLGEAVFSDLNKIGVADVYNIFGDDKNYDISNWDWSEDIFPISGENSKN